MKFGFKFSESGIQDKTDKLCVSELVLTKMEEEMLKQILVLAGH